MTVRESRFCDEGLPHPVIKIETKKPHRSPKHTRGVGEIRIELPRQLENSKHRGLGKKAISKARTGFRILEIRGAAGEICVSYWCYYPRLSQIAAITPIRHYVSL